MKEIFLGEVIRQRRLELGLTQEELCQGICEPMTISRFENGKQTPSRNRIKALLQRLGLPDDRFYGLLSDRETQLAVLEKDIVSCHVRFEKAFSEDRKAIRAEALEKHKQMEEIMEKDDTLSRQFLLRSKCLLGKEDGDYSFEERMSMLLDAMRLTCPQFDLNRIGEGLYTEVEIKIINGISNAYLRAERHYEAIDILKSLLRYLQTHQQKAPSSRMLIPLITFNYSRELGEVGRYDEAAEMAEYGKKVCIDYGHYQLLPDLISNLAICRYHQGRTEESAELFCQSNALYKALEDSCNRAIIQKTALKYLNLILD